MFFQGSIITKVVVRCPTVRKVNLAVGGNDGRLKQMTQKVQKDLQEAFLKFVNIEIVIVSIKKE